MKLDCDVKILEKQYQKGDLVYVLDTAIIKGKCKNLSPPWKGPGVVLDRLTPYIYKIKFQRVILTANHDRLKACISRHKMNIFGVKPVLRLIQERIAPASWGKCSSQFSWELSTNHLTAVIKLLFCLST
jgi:hypothetical protein